MEECPPQEREAEDAFEASDSLDRLLEEAECCVGGVDGSPLRLASLLPQHHHAHTADGNTVTAATSVAGSPSPLRQHRASSYQRQPMISVAPSHYRDVSVADEAYGLMTTLEEDRAESARQAICAAEMADGMMQELLRAREAARLQQLIRGSQQQAAAQTVSVEDSATHRGGPARTETSAPPAAKEGDRPIPAVLDEGRSGWDQQQADAPLEDLPELLCEAAMESAEVAVHVAEPVDVSTAKAAVVADPLRLHGSTLAAGHSHGHGHTAFAPSDRRSVLAVDTDTELAASSQPWPSAPATLALETFAFGSSETQQEPLVPALSSSPAERSQSSSPVGGEARPLRTARRPTLVLADASREDFAAQDPLTLFESHKVIHVTSSGKVAATSTTTAQSSPSVTCAAATTQTDTMPTDTAMSHTMAADPAVVPALTVCDADTATDFPMPSLPTPVERADAACNTLLPALTVTAAQTDVVTSATEAASAAATTVADAQTETYPHTQPIHTNPPAAEPSFDVADAPGPVTCAVEAADGAGNSQALHQPRAGDHPATRSSFPDPARGVEGPLAAEELIPVSMPVSASSLVVGVDTIEPVTASVGLTAAGTVVGETLMPAPDAVSEEETTVRMVPAATVPSTAVSAGVQTSPREDAAVQPPTAAEPEEPTPSAMPQVQTCEAGTMTAQVPETPTTTAVPDLPPIPISPPVRCGVDVGTATDASVVVVSIEHQWDYDDPSLLSPSSAPRPLSDMGYEDICADICTTATQTEHVGPLPTGASHTTTSAFIAALAARDESDTASEAPRATIEDLLAAQSDDGDTDDRSSRAPDSYSGYLNPTYINEHRSSSYEASPAAPQLPAIAIGTCEAGVQTAPISLVMLAQERGIASEAALWNIPLTVRPDLLSAPVTARPDLFSAPVTGRPQDAMITARPPNFVAGVGGLGLGARLSSSHLNRSGSDSLPNTSFPNGSMPMPRMSVETAAAPEEFNEPVRSRGGSSMNPIVSDVSRNHSDSRNHSHAPPLDTPSPSPVHIGAPFAGNGSIPDVGKSRDELLGMVAAMRQAMADAQAREGALEGEVMRLTSALTGRSNEIRLLSGLLAQSQTRNADVATMLAEKLPQAQARPAAEPAPAPSPPHAPMLIEAKPTRIGAAAALPPSRVTVTRNAKAAVARPSAAAANSGVPSPAKKTVPAQGPGTSGSGSFSRGGIAVAAASPSSKKPAPTLSSMRAPLGASLAARPAALSASLASRTSFVGNSSPAASPTAAVRGAKTRTNL